MLNDAIKGHTPEISDADIQAGIEAAQEVEKRIGYTIANSVDELCTNPSQKIVASAVITAVMISKFQTSKLAVPDESFGRCVDALVEKLQPTAEKEARKVHDMDLSGEVHP